MQKYNLGPRRYESAIKILSYLSAAWCGIAIIVVGAFLICNIGILICGTLLDPRARKLSVVGLVAPFIVLLLGVALGRFLLRALPPRLSERTRLGWYGTIGAIALCVVFIGVLVLGVFQFLAISLVDQSTSKPLDDTDLAIIGVSTLLAMLYMGCAIGPLILRHQKPRAFLDRPFVLFLRRFSTFSDRSVIVMVLKQAASGVPVVFLTPTLSQPGDWEPFLVGFAGLKLLHPWQSMPIILRAPDDDWQRVADELIRRAQTILLDTSDMSSALRTEAEMIDTAGRWSNTVCLRLLARNADPGIHLFGGFGRARVIDYMKSWVRALPRMVAGLATVLITAFFLFMTVLASAPVFMIGWLEILMLIAAAYTYYSVFVRPAINREAKLALRAVLRSGR